MLTKNEIKYLKSLHQKKERWEARHFICEGDKLVEEALNSHFKVLEIFCTKGNEDRWNECKNLRIISAADMERISGLSTPPGIVALIEIPEFKEPGFDELKGQLFFILDGINDPGNLGTIIRIADWFGISHVFCSRNTTDVFNQKCIQSSMGSIFRVQLHYADLQVVLNTAKGHNIPVFAAVMDGHPAKPGFTKNGGILLGSESHGIAAELLLPGLKKITIPSFGEAESLNVAVAAGILAAYCRIPE